jgi:hypothetical protein
MATLGSSKPVLKMIAGARPECANRINAEMSVMKRYSNGQSNEAMACPRVAEGRMDGDTNGYL